MRSNTPPDFTPPYDAFEAQYSEPAKPMVSAFIGVQDRGGADGEASRQAASLRDILAGPDGPDIIEQGLQMDVPDRRDPIFLCYWRDPARFAAWYGSKGFRAWLVGDTAAGPVGRWIEHAHINPTHLDTLLADKDIYWGLAKLSDRIDLTPYHGYWGGTRDRIRASENDALENDLGPALIEPPLNPSGFGEVLEVAMPGNVVVARGGPDWSRCVGDERRMFEESVHPAFVAGGRYLKENPAEAGCYSSYLVNETDAAGAPFERQHQIAYFVQLSDLERWTKSHPTHVAIFARFIEMVRAIGRMPAVNLYHEVSVIPAGGLRAAYANCAPETGLLRFARLPGECPEPTVAARP